MITELTEQEAYTLGLRAIEENKEMKRLMKRLLRVLRGPPEWHSIQGVTYGDMARAIEDSIEKSGIDLT